MDAIILHDTYRILEASAEAGALFRCEPGELVDLDVSTGAYGGDKQALLRMRFRAIREHGYLPPAVFPFQRRDGTVFWAATSTRKIEDGVYQTTLFYLREADPDERL